MQTGAAVAARLALLSVATWAGRAGADAVMPCSADGAPEGAVEASVLGAAGVVPWSGRASNLHLGDPVAAADPSAPIGNHFVLRTARFGVCGRILLRVGALLYRVVYEPWDSLERAQPDHAGWGRLAASEVGWAPFSWLSIYAGIHKVAFSFGHDEREGELALPLRAAPIRAIAPDRRLGLALGVDFLALKLEAGLYASARPAEAITRGGLYLTARAVVEPIGPVGPAVSTVRDAPFWRARPRIGLGLSALYEWSPEPGVSAWALGVDVPFKWGPVGVVAEYLYDGGTLPEWPARTSRQEARQGASAEAAVLVLRPWLELAARWEWLSDPTPDTSRHAVVLGLSTYLPGLGRLQASYGHQVLGGAGIDRDYALLVLTVHGAVARAR